MKKRYFVLLFALVAFLFVYSAPLKSVIGQENSGLNGEMNVSFVYEGQNTIGWKFIFTSREVSLKALDLDENKEQIFRDLDLTKFLGSMENCEYYSFSFGRGARTLSYELPGESETPLQTEDGVFCKYSIEPITNDLNKILSLGGMALDPNNVCPDSQQKELEEGTSECPETQSCSVLISAGATENFGFGITRDSNGEIYVIEDNDRNPIGDGESDSRAQEFINNCLQGDKAGGRALTLHVQTSEQTGDNSYNPYDSIGSASSSSEDDSSPYCSTQSQVGCGNSGGGEPNFNLNSCGCEGIINPEKQSDCSSASDAYSDPEAECVLVDYYSGEEVSDSSISNTLDELYGSSKTMQDDKTASETKGESLSKKAKPYAKKKKCVKKKKRTASAPNPCGSDNAKCGCCMAFAESSGNTIRDECMTAVLCTIKNRINKAVFPPKAANVCAVVSQKSPNGAIQYDPYRCVGNSAYANSKYCRCCKDQLNSVEIAEKNVICGSNPPACDCNGADSFNNAGMNSWASRNCQKVTVSCCSTFDFYKCS